MTEVAEDYYGLLGLGRFATPVEIRRAYRTLALQLHPDRNPSGTDTLFKKVSHAYSILSDAKLKSVYDTKLFSDYRFHQFEKHAPTPFPTHQQPPQRGPAPASAAPRRSSNVYTGPGMPMYAGQPASSFAQQRPQTAHPKQAEHVPQEASANVNSKGESGTERKQTVSGYGLSKDEINELEAMKRRHDAAQRVYEKMMHGGNGNTTSTQPHVRPSTAATERTSTSAAQPQPPRNMNHTRTFVPKPGETSNTTASSSGINAHTIDHVLQQLQKERDNIDRYEAEQKERLRKEQNAQRRQEEEVYRKAKREQQMAAAAAAEEQELVKKRHAEVEAKRRKAEAETWRYAAPRQEAKPESVPPAQPTSRRGWGEELGSKPNSSPKKEEDPIEALEREILKREQNITQRFNSTSTAAPTEQMPAPKLQRPGSAKFSDGINRNPQVLGTGSSSNSRPSSAASFKRQFPAQTDTPPAQSQSHSSDDSSKTSTPPLPPPLNQTQLGSSIPVEPTPSPIFARPSSASQRPQAEPRKVTVPVKPSEPAEKPTESPPTLQPTGKSTPPSHEGLQNQNTTSLAPSTPPKDKQQQPAPSTSSATNSPFTPRYMYRSAFGTTGSNNGTVNSANGEPSNQGSGNVEKRDREGYLNVPSDDEISRMTDPTKLKELLQALEQKAKTVRQTLLLQDFQTT